MTEELRLALSIASFVVSGISLIIVFTYSKKVLRKEKELINKLEEETYKYYQELTLLEDRYFPYFKEHAAGVRKDKNSLGDGDNITSVKVGKKKKFYFDKIFYILNNQMRYSFKTKSINGMEYIVIDDDIKTLELLVSFEKPSNFLIRYQIKKIENNKYKLELIEEVNEDDTRRNEIC